jgi:glycosyltransferase involved in cell wall biosynthesis
MILQICHFYRNFYPFGTGGVETQTLLTTNFLSNYDNNLHFSLITSRQYLLPFLHKNVPKRQYYGNLKVLRLGPNIPEITLYALQNNIRVPKQKLEKIQRIVAHQLFLEAAKIREVKEADVFHTHIAGEDPMDMAICEQLPVELSRKFGKPLITQLHGTFLPGPETMSLTKERREIIFENSSAITTNNTNAFEKLKEWKLEKKAYLIPNGVDLEKFRISKRNLRKNGFKILFIGRITAYRDPVTAIFAFKLLLKKFPDARLHIVGGGPLENPVQRLVQQLDMDKSVVMYGSRMDVDLFLQKSDVFWTISPINNYPSNSLMEALASSLPVVATDTGLTKELIVDKQNGLLVSPRNPRELANATEEILTDGTLRNFLSINARATAEKYDYKVIYPRIAQLYYSVSSKR